MYEVALNILMGSRIAYSVSMNFFLRDTIRPIYSDDQSNLT